MDYICKPCPQALVGVCLYTESNLIRIYSNLDQLPLEMATLTYPTASLQLLVWWQADLTWREFLKLPEAFV